MKQLRLLMVTLLGASLALGGCGGGGSSSTASDSGAALSGVVADGYLNGALVFIDVDGDKVHDPDTEPAAESGAGGKYSIGADEMAKLAGADPTQYAVVVEVTATVIDEDTGDQVGHAYSLSAPAGKHEFVSPVTTLVHEQMEKNPNLDVDEAEQVVKEQIGVSEETGLFEDYVDQTNLDANQELAQVHQIAQVVAEIMGAMENTFDTAAENGGYDQKDVLSAIVTEVFGRLQEIVTATAEAENFDPKTVSGSVFTAPTETEAEAALAVAEVESAVQKVPFREALGVESGGVSWFELHHDGWEGTVELSYGTVTIDEQDQLQEAGFEYDFEADVPAWVADGDGDDHGGFLLGANGWTPFDDGPGAYKVAFNTDGTVTLTRTVDGATETLSAVKYDLAGKKMAAFAGELGPFFTNPEATFADGALAYRLNFVNNEAAYEVWGDEWNTVYLWNNGDETALTSLDQMLDVYSHAAEGGDYLGIGRDLSVRFAEDGTLYLYGYTPGTWPPTPLDMEGSWTRETVHGQSLILVKVPGPVAEKHEVEGAPFFVAWEDGTVKRGEYTPAGSVHTDMQFNFNGAAIDALKANLAYTRIATIADGGYSPGDEPTQGGEEHDPEFDFGTGTAVAPLSMFDGEALHWLEVYRDWDDTLGAEVYELEKGQISYNAETSEITETEFYYDGGWNTETDPSDYVLASSGWVPESEGVETLSAVTNLTADLTNFLDDELIARETLTAVQYDIAGIPMSELLDGPGTLLTDATAVMPEGSVAYKVSGVAVTDSYFVEDDDWATVGTWNDTGMSMTPVVSLTEMTTAFASGGDQLLWLERDLAAKFGSDTLEFYRTSPNMAPEQLETSGSWAMETVNGVELLKLNIPAQYLVAYDFEEIPFFVQWPDGQGGTLVKRGDYAAAGTAWKDDDPMLNGIAFDALLDNLAPEALSAAN